MASSTLFRSKSSAVSETGSESKKAQGKVTKAFADKTTSFCSKLIAVIENYLKIHKKLSDEEIRGILSKHSKNKSLKIKAKSTFDLGIRRARNFYDTLSQLNELSYNEFMRSVCIFVDTNLRESSSEDLRDKVYKALAEEIGITFQELNYKSMLFSVVGVYDAVYAERSEESESIPLASIEPEAECKTDGSESIRPRTPSI